MTENEIARVIVDAAYKIHTSLGPGLLGSVCDSVLDHELTSRGLTAQRQKTLPGVHDGLRLEEGFRAELVVVE